MLGINFSGNLNRKQYWLRLILLFLISIIVFGSFFARYHTHVIKTFQKLVAIETLEERQNNPDTLDEREKLKETIKRKDLLSPDSKKEIEIFIEESKAMSSNDLENVIKTQNQKKIDIIFNILILLFVLYITLVFFSLYVRRGHDLQISGWITVLMALIPIVNLIYCYVYLGFFPGKNKT